MASYDEDQAIWFESQWGFGFGRQRDNEATFLQLLFSESPALLCWLQNVQTHKRTLLNALLHFTSWHLNTFCDQFWGIWWFLVQHQLPVVCGGSQGWVGLWSIGHSGCHCRYHHCKPTSFWFCDIPFHLTYKIGWSSVSTSSCICIYIVCCLIHLDFTAIVTYCWVQGQMLLLWIHGVGISALNTPLQDSRDDEEGEQLILKRMLMFSQLASSPHPGDVKKSHIWGQIFKMRDNLQRSSPPHRERMWRNDTLGIVVKVLAGRQRLKAGHLWLSSEEFHYPPPQKKYISQRS